MANNKFYVKRTSVSGRTPNVSSSGNSSYIGAGEFGLNMADGILYTSNGSALITVGANNVDVNVSNTLTVKAITANGGNGTSGQVLTSNGSGTYWSTISSTGGGASRVYQSFTATDGQTVFTVSGGYTNNLIDVFYNGVHLSNTEYTQNGSAVTLTSGANNGAIVEVSGYILTGDIISLDFVVGSNTEIYFNDSNTSSTDANFLFNKTTTTLTIGNNSVNTQVTPGNVFLNGSKLVVGNTTSNVTINATAIVFGTSGNITGTSYSGTSNNSTYAFGKTEGNLNVNNAVTANSANNASYLNGVVGTGFVQNTDTRVLSGNLNFTGTNNYFSAMHYANGITTVSNSGIVFAPARNPTFVEGLVYYDNVDKAITVYNDTSGFIFRVGQQEYVRVWNESGATIAKGKPVYISGTHGTHYHPMIDLADASSVTSYDCIGLAGHDIADQTHGYVVTRGWVGGFNTSGLTANERVHVGFSSPGNLVTSAPQYPNYPIDIGYCMNSDAANGYIYVQIAQHTVEQLRVVNDGYIGGDLTVAGDLNITGNVTTTSATTIATSENIIYLAGGDTIATTNFTGSGLNDAEFGGVYEGTGTTTYYVKIDSTGATDTFAWSKNDFSTTIASNISITGGNQALDNGIYIKFQATTGHTLNDKWSGTAAPVNVDLGWAGNYNDGTYHHAGLFRDASDGYFKVFDNYAPELSANVNIDTANATFRIAKFWSDAINIGNTSVYATINSTAYTGLANDASYLGGTEAIAYVTNSGSYTISGVHTHTANLVANLVSANTINAVNNINAASLSVGTASFVANSSGVFSNNHINLTVNNDRLTFTPLAGGSNTYFILQNDDNFVFYATNTSNQPRAIWSVFANSVTSNLNISVPLNASAGIVPRASSSASVTSPLTWNSDNSDQIAYTALANALTINADSGNPVDGQKIVFRFKDNGTPRTITFTTGASKAFRAIGTTIPVDTVANKTVYVGCIYHATDARWDIVAIATEA